MDGLERQQGELINYRARRHRHHGCRSSPVPDPISRMFIVGRHANPMPHPHLSTEMF